MLAAFIFVFSGGLLGLAAAPLLPRVRVRGTSALMAGAAGVVGLSAAVFAAQHDSGRIPPGILQALSVLVPADQITLIEIVKNDGTPETFVKQNLQVDPNTDGVSFSTREDDKTIEVTTTIRKDMLPAGEPVQKVVPGIVIRAGTSSWVWDCKLVGGEVVCKKVQV